MFKGRIDTVAERACKWCGEVFAANLSQKYCTAACKRSFARNRSKNNLDFGIDYFCRHPGCDRRRLRKPSRHKIKVMKIARTETSDFAPWCWFHSDKANRETPEQRRARLDPGRLNGLG